MNDESKLVRAIFSINRVVGQGVSWLLLPLMLVIVFDVVGRRFFNVGSVALQEIEWHLHTLIFLFAAAYAYQRDGHVRITMLRDRCSERTKAWIEAGGCLIALIPYAALLSYLSYAYFAYSFSINEASEAPGGLSARWFLKAFFPIAFALLALQGVATLLSSLREARKRRQGSSS